MYKNYKRKIFLSYNLIRQLQYKPYFTARNSFCFIVS